MYDLSKILLNETGFLHFKDPIFKLAVRLTHFSATDKIYPIIMG